MTVFKRIRDRAPRTAIDQQTQGDDQCPHTEKHYEKLDEVRPDHCFHTAGTGIDDADNTDNQNRYPAGPSGGGFKDLAGGQKHSSGIKHLAVSIADGADKTGIFIVTVRQIFKRREGFDLEKEFGKDHHRNHPDKGHDQTQYPPVQPVVVNLAGSHYQTVSGKYCHKHRHCHREVRHLATAQQKVSSIVVALGKIPADRQHTGKIQYDHRVIPPLKSQLIHYLSSSSFIYIGNYVCDYKYKQMK